MSLLGIVKKFLRPVAASGPDGTRSAYTSTRSLDIKFEYVLFQALATCLFRLALQQRYWKGLLEINIASSMKCTHHVALTRIVDKASMQIVN